MLRVMIGYDERQPVAYNVMQSSIVRHASLPVSITPLILRQLPLRRKGLTNFTYSRFLVPYLMGFKGWALFVDPDMVVTGDIAELFRSADPEADVMVNTQQPEFEWGSAMLFNCEKCRILTPEYIEDRKRPLFDLNWATTVRAFPPEWNHCVNYTPVANAKLYHYTEGLPCWKETSGAPEDVHWEKEHKLMNSTVRWQELMGTSVHAQRTLKRLHDRELSAGGGAAVDSEDACLASGTSP